MKNYRRNNYIGKMKKGFKQKLSLLMIACLLFTGYRGLTISGRADSSHTEQNNEIEVSGTQVKVQLLGADLRRAATEAILKGEKVGKSNLRSYSKDQELATEFEEYFDGEKEIYNIPLNSIAENLEESLNAEEAGLQIYVERDAKDLDRLVRKESKESLLLYSKESAVAGLLPKKEEATTVSLTEEEKASDSNLERNTELTGSELITFVYENKSTERMTFQLSVDGNKYPKVTVASKTSLFKQFLGDAKKAQAEAKNAKATEAKAESTEAQTVEASKAEESSTEAKQEVAESKATAETKATEESKASEEARKDDSEVAIVSTAAEAVAESTEAKAEVKTEASEEATEARVEATEAEVKEAAAKAETAQAEKATEAQKAVVEDSSLLKDITEHSEEILSELQSIRFTQYSLNELGRKSQNVEIEGFGNVQVFYDEAAFDGDVVLEAKRLFKPEEEAEGEKLSEEQVKVLKEHSIYDDAASLDIRFVDKKDSAVEVEPKSPVSVRISIDKKALPADVSSDEISIHHLVENDETKAIEKVEVVVQSLKAKNEEATELNETTEPLVKEENKEETITKEFVVDSFSLYQINWNDSAVQYCPPIIFHYVDKNFNEIGPTVRTVKTYKTGLEKYIKKEGSDPKTWQLEVPGDAQGDINIFDKSNKSGEAYKTFNGYDFLAAYPYRPGLDNLDKIVNGHTNDYFDINYKYNQDANTKYNGNFRSGISKIDNLGYIIDGQRYVWYTLRKGTGHYEKNCAYEFYFVYDLENKTGQTIQDEHEESNEKYITNNLDGTYDLTLTAKTSYKNKEKLDVVFLVDTTRSMNLPFGTENGLARYTSNDYETTGNSRKAKVNEQINKLVDSLSQNENYDLQYALVGFGGNRTVNVADNRFVYNNVSVMDANGNEIKKYSVPIIGENDLTIEDTPYNDAEIYGYTKNAAEFKQRLKSLPENQGEVDGRNYSAGIIGLRYVLDGFGKTAIANDKIRDGNAPRSDAKKIYIMISDGDPTYSYTATDGLYDDTIMRFKFGNDRFQYEKNLAKGYTYGNGRDFSRVGLNQARGYLAQVGGYSAFYTIGVGNQQNWKHLRELTEEHGYDLDPKWASIGNRKYIRSGTPLAKGADGQIFDGSTPDNLANSFKQLSDKIAPKKATNITIKDTFSENVDLVANTELVAEIYKLADNNVETVGSALTPDEYHKLNLNKLVPEKSWNKVKNRQEIGLKTDPEDFELPAGYEIRLTAKIKPSKIAYEKLRKGEAEKNIGEARTDLNDIYKTYLNGRKFGPDEQYGASTDIKGLFTNDEAKFNYKWRGQPQEKRYNKPIIKVQQREIVIEKQILGLEGKAYLEGQTYKSKEGSSKSGFTNLGIAVLRDINFTVYEVQDDGTEKEYVSFKLYQDGNSEDQSKEGIIKVGDITVKRHQVVYNAAYDRLSLGYTISGLNPNKKYRVVETAPNKSYGYQNQEHLYKFISKENNTEEKPFKLTEKSQVVVVNNYNKEKPKKKVTIEKLVENALKSDGYVSEEDKKRDFDFYLRVYHPDTKNAQNKPIPGKAFSIQELEELKKTFPTNVQNKFTDIVEVPPQSGVYALHFKLRNKERLEFSLDEDLKYSFSELKVEGFTQPEVYKNKTSETDLDYCDLVPDSAAKYWFTCDRLSVKDHYFVQFVNKTTKVPVPTGIVRDITPYLFGIFGFVAMAGAYLTISKKRREV
ncbi:hypothetical protein [uncultured Oribacterium sp.]|nr:hypothetical protein [uncultured Oribacterium sp.]